MTAPKPLEILSCLLRVLENQAAEAREAIAIREARIVTADSVLAAIRQCENTWNRLHAWFPESQWKALTAELDRLQRAEQIYRDSHLDFRLGSPYVSWVLERF